MASSFRRRLLAGAAAAFATPGAHAIMAGAPPDTPAARVDPNTPDSRWTSVGAVQVGGDVYSGVAISPLDVLTAVHVLGSATPAQVQFIVNTSAAPISRAVQTIHRFPSAAFPYDDWALLRLAAPLPPEVRPHPILDTPLATGYVVTIVGYGASGNGSGGGAVGTSTTVKRVGENVVDVRTDRIDQSGRTSPFFLYDFDGPSGAGPLGGPTLGNTRESSPAGGDSGGGAFVYMDGRWLLAGLNTLIVQLSPAFTTPSQFGYGAGGILLSDPRVLTWIAARASGYTLASDAVVPLPLWATLALGAGLAGSCMRRSRSQRPD